MKHVIFDLDGTLADTSVGIYSSFSLACSELGLTCPVINDFVQAIGPPVSGLLNLFYPELSLDKRSKFVSTFRASYDSTFFLEAVLYQAVADVLSCIDASPEFCMSVVTNKPTRPARALLQQLGILKYFEMVVGVDHFSSRVLLPYPTPKAANLNHLLQLFSSWVNCSCYVGDTVSDLLCCRQLDLDFIAAVYGFYSWEPRQLPPVVIHGFADLMSVLAVD